MSRTLIVLFLLTLFKISFGQIDTLKFKQFGDGTEFSELNLNPDKTFAFHHYNFRSCWTWHSVYGTWSVDNNKIVFIDTIHWEEDSMRMDTSANNSTDYIQLTVKNDNGKPLKGIKIQYTLRRTPSCDTYLTDENGQIKISKSVKAKQKHKSSDNSSVQFGIQFNNQKSPYCSISTSFEASYDKIDITIVDDPKEEVILRTTVYQIIGSEIYFESQKYSVDKGYWPRNWGNFRRSPDPSVVSITKSYQLKHEIYFWFIKLSQPFIQTEKLKLISSF